MTDDLSDLLVCSLLTNKINIDAFKKLNVQAREKEEVCVCCVSDTYILIYCES